MQNPNKNSRSGDEYYTQLKTYKRLEERLKDTLQQYDYIWMPFNSDGRDFIDYFKEKGYKVITSKEKWFDGKMRNFFNFQYDTDFCEILKKNKVLLFDNPPFSKLSVIIRATKGKKDLLSNYTPFDYILFGNSLTMLSTISMFSCGVRSIGVIKFLPDTTRRLNICLFSNIWDDIAFIEGVSDETKILPESEIINLERFRNKPIPSATLCNFLQRGFVIKLKDIKRFRNEFFGMAIDVDVDRINKIDIKN